VSYRKIEKIPEEWGTAVNVSPWSLAIPAKIQDRVPLPATLPQEKRLLREWLPNARRGCGGRHKDPHPVNKAARLMTQDISLLEEAMPLSTSSCLLSRKGSRNIIRTCRI